MQLYIDDYFYQFECFYPPPSPISKPHGVSNYIHSSLLNKSHIRSLTPSPSSKVQVPVIPAVVEVDMTPLATEPTPECADKYTACQSPFWLGLCDTDAEVKIKQI